MELLKFVGSDENCTHLVKENVTTIVSSHGSSNKGSSKLTLKNFVNFNWEQSYYQGQLIALHLSEKYIAYGFTKPGTSEGLVRVVKRETNDRILIKGFSSFIEDLKFAYLHNFIMLACVDQSGSVYVYTVSDNGTALKANLVFQINEDPSYNYKNKHLLSWCQYIPEQLSSLRELELSSTYSGKILAIVRGGEVEIWHVGMAVNFTTGPVNGNLDLNEFDNNGFLDSIKKTLFKIDFFDSDIVNVSFSPTGSSVAIALNSGTINFYEINFDSVKTESPQCIFSWNPTELCSSLRSMAFLDNHKQTGDLELWKYVVTLTDDNELLLWSCVTWLCLQKLTFVRCSTTNNPMKLTVDETGKFIFLSDIDFNLLYVLEVSLDINCPEKNIKIVSISEIMLQSPMLNMIIVDTKIDHNDLNNFEQFKSGHAVSDNIDKFTTIINLLAIQPKSIQEGQLIVSSPELSIMDQFNIRPNTFPRPPSLDVDTTNPALPELGVKKDKTNSLMELSSMDLHKLVKEKLKGKGVNIVKKKLVYSTNEIKLPEKKEIKFDDVEETPAVQLPTDFPEMKYTLEEERECSPSNNEVQNILNNQEHQFEYKTIPMSGMNFDSYAYESEFSNGVVKEEHQYSDSMYNGAPTSAIMNPKDNNESLDFSGMGNQADISSIYACLDGINSKLESLTKKQKCNSDQFYQKIQSLMDQKLNEHLIETAEIVKKSTKVDTDLFTKTLVTSLSPTLDAILKDLFMSTVIPKFEHACSSMFKQIDASFTERSLEYQNELKILLNAEGNINGKLEYAFDKFKSDMSGIIKHSEKNILCTQSDMQKQFTQLLKEKSLSVVESYVKDSENVAYQISILGNIIDRGDHTTALEKALSASNLDLVLYVCERVSSDDIFLPPFELKTPIVLSLIQQLSHDLSMNTELKYKYLDDAVGSLDYQNDHYKENIHFVLQKMEKSVEKFLQQNPLHAYCRKFKMLQFAVKTILSHNIK